MRNALSLINSDSRDILRQLHSQGAISIPALKEMQRAEKQEERVIIRPHETIHETVRTTVEVYYFE